MAALDIPEKEVGFRPRGLQDTCKILCNIGFQQGVIQRVFVRIIHVGEKGSQTRIGHVHFGRLDQAACPVFQKGYQSVKNAEYLH